MIKKYFCCSDIHGFYDQWMSALSNSGFEIDNPNHILVICGDLLDRGRQPRQCLQFVNKLPPERKILIKGNHEYLMEEMLSRGEALQHDYSNGTLQTVSDMAPDLTHDFYECIEDMERDHDWKKYIKSVRDYHETKKHIFVHGWIPCISNGEKPWYIRDVDFTFDENWRKGNWYLASWGNPFEQWSQGIFVQDKTIVCGHWHTSWAHHFLHNDGGEFENGKFTPFIDDGIIGLDGCVAHTKNVNVVVLEDEDL